MRSALSFFSVLAVLSLLLLPGVPLIAQEFSGGAATKENLDLPFDAQGESEEEEDAPEIVTFYGQQLEGDGIFYCVDRSSSMGDKGELNIAKREISRNIQEFSERVEFGIVFFDAGLMKYPASGQPAQANPGMKSSAQSFVMGVVGGGGSCVQQGLVTCLQIANLASARRKVMVYLGDGRGHCHGADEATYLNQTLSAVTSQNYQRIPINCIMVLDRTDRGEDFMRKLSASNGGTYTIKVN